MSIYKVDNTAPDFSKLFCKRVLESIKESESIRYDPIKYNIYLEDHTSFQSWLGKYNKNTFLEMDFFNHIVKKYKKLFLSKGKISFILVTRMYISDGSYYTKIINNLNKTRYKEF